MEKSKTVLLIDDDKEEYELFCIALEKYKPEISCIHTYDCAAEFNNIKGRILDWIFLDFNLPIFNGFECLKKIKENSFLKDIPVYMYSASLVDKSVETLCLENGAIAWLKKPAEVKGYYQLFDEIFT